MEGKPLLHKPSGASYGSLMGYGSFPEPVSSKARKPKPGGASKAPPDGREDDRRVVDVRGITKEIIGPVHGVRRRRGVGKLSAPAVTASPKIGTVRAMSSCEAFQLQEVYNHYASRGVDAEFLEPWGIVCLTIKLPLYRFDSVPDEQMFPRAESSSIQAAGDSSEFGSKPADVREINFIDQDDSSEDVEREGFNPRKEYEIQVYFHSYGVVVWWSPFPPGLDLEHAGNPLLGEIDRMKNVFEHNSLSKIEVDTCRWQVTAMPQSDSEDDTSRKRKPYAEKAPKSYIDQDCFYFDRFDTQYMLAYGCGLAQSAKVSEFENNIEDLVEETKEYPIRMAKDGKSDLSINTVARIRGQLFIHRMHINLHTDILETPEIFWTRTDLEPLYLQVRRHMEISHRTGVLNKRLEIVQDLFAVFHEELNTNHSNYLEWIIIWLIVLEVILGIASAVFGLE